MARAKRLTGLNPLAYMGVEAETPSQFTIQQRDPTTHDFSNWDIGAVWLTQDTSSIFMLVAKKAGIATWVQMGAVDLAVETLTGDSGGAVSPDVDSNIDMVSGFAPLTFDGSPSTNTLTLNSDGTLAISYPTDSGTAVPAAGVLTIAGGAGVDTSGAGSTVTIAAAATVATQYDADAGSAVPAANILNIVGGTGIDTTGAGSTITIAPSGEIATSYVTDSGTATPAASVLNVLGGTSANTAGAGATVTFNMDSLGGPGVVVTDAGGVYSSINGTDGQVIIAATGADPAWATIASADGSVTFTPGANSLDLSVVTSGTVTGGENINISGTNVVNLNRTIHWPHTNAAGTEGAIYLGGSGGSGGDIFMHNYTASGSQYNTFLGINAGNLSGSVQDQNVGIGESALSSITTTGRGNNAVGSGALENLTTAVSNNAFGYQALNSITTNSSNIAIGYQAGMSLQASAANGYNTMMGYQAGKNFNGNGTENVMVGYQAGINYTGSEYNNICIDNDGVVGENRTIRIGNTAHTKCFIDGIHGKSASGAIAVYINSDGQLGTTTSSLRYKENVSSLDAYSERIFDLNPVSFTYKEDDTHEKQYGLIAEEVEQVLPELVVHTNGEPDAVQYHNLVPMLLNEFKKLSNRLDALEKKASSYAESTADRGL
jgi:hypothetical protein